MPTARAKAEGRNVDDVLQEDAQNDLNLTDDETASDVDNVGQAAAGNSPDGRTEPMSAPKRGASTGRGRGSRGTPAGRGGRGKATPRVTAAPRRAKSIPGSGTNKQRNVNQDGLNNARSGESVFMSSTLHSKSFITIENNSSVL
jgi:hypothetical protein